MTTHQRTSSGDWRRHQPRPRVLVEPPNLADLILQETQRLAKVIGEEAGYAFCQSIPADASPFDAWSAILHKRIDAEIDKWRVEHLRKYDLDCTCKPDAAGLCLACTEHVRQTYGDSIPVEGV